MGASLESESSRGALLGLAHSICTFAGSGDTSEGRHSAQGISGAHQASANAQLTRLAKTAILYAGVVMRILVLTALLPFVGMAQTADELMAMERFAAAADVRRSTHIETIVAESTTARISTVVLADGTRELRGVRI